MAENLLRNLLAIALVVVFFGGSILIHELGHYIVAKKRKMFVPKFSIGFGPKICGFKFKETEFVISLFPIGGYVALPQLADLKELEGDFDVPKNLAPAKSLDKILTAAAGPSANFLLSIFLAMVVYFIGLPVNEEVLSTHVGYVPEVMHFDDGTTAPSPAHQAGIQPNDEILSVDGHTIARFDEIPQLIALGSEKNYLDGRPMSLIRIRREGQVLDVPVYPEVASCTGQKDDKMRMLGVYPRQTLIIEGLYGDAEANAVALQTGDKILSANGIPIFHNLKLREITASSEVVTLEVERNNRKILCEVPTMKLAVSKPFLSLMFSEKHRIIDIIPQINSSKEYDLATPDKFATFELFCSDKNFLRKHSISNGDRVISVNGKSFSSLHELRELLGSGHEIFVEISSNGTSKGITLPGISNVVVHDADIKNFLGVTFAERVVMDHPSPAKQIKGTVDSTFKTLHSLFSKTSNISAKHLMGPAGLIKTLHFFAKTNFSWLLWFVILINVNLAILNLLPFPVLDGGLIVVAALEKITGCRWVGRVFAKIQGICIAMLIGLILYVTFYDLRRIWTTSHESFESQRQSRITLHY